MRISISAAVTATGIALIAGVLVTLVTGAGALNRLKVNGPIYEDIIYSKDLIADILPPDSNDKNQNLFVSHFIDQPVSGTTQFDLVTIQMS